MSAKSSARGLPAASASVVPAVPGAASLLPTVQHTIAMLQKNSLAGAVQQEIERLITNGDLLPGDKLTEQSLAERLGVSRGPVREAFRVLEEAGLLKLEKNRGVSVRRVPLEEALEIFDLRAILEAHVGATLATRITPAQVLQLERLIDAMEEAVRTDDETGYYALNVEFHESMVGLAGNQKLLALYKRLTRELGLYRRRNLSDQKLLLKSIKDHRDMLTAIKSGIPERAADALRAHVLASRERTLTNDPERKSAPVKTKKAYS